MMEPGNEDKRYIIGIDLGTSNSSMAFVDSQSARKAIELFPIMQEGLEKKLEYHQKLPSFCYQKLPSENLSTVLPWKDGDYLLGYVAKAKKRPKQIVASAKSWLCHPRLDRRQAILPLDASDPSLRISPLEASRRYLNHLREAWNASKGDKENARLEDQEIVITVPASFDELARSLTVEAAKLAGFGSLHLLEEPQAAFYEAKKQQEFFDGEMILVCDIGGGTSDFTLIEHRQGVFHRMYVGRHLLLGGDNMDVFLAKELEKLFQAPLTHEQYLQLELQAKEIKEELFSGKSKTLEACLQGSGSSLVGGSLSFQADRQALQERLLEGFFPKLAWEQALCLKPPNALRRMGLDYESEPTITRHLAAFLEKAVFPDSVCFNGAALKPKVFQEAIMNCLRLWSGKELRLLENKSLDYSVAKGACEFGLSKRGLGKGIISGLSRGYYLAIEKEKEKKLLTLLAKGALEGKKESIDLPLFLRPNEPVAFEVYRSQTRFSDKSGDLVDYQKESFEALPPLKTCLNVGKKTAEERILVALEISFSDLGIVELSVVERKTKRRWNLQFSAFDLAQERVAKLEVCDQAALEEANACIETSFEKEALQDLVPKLEKLLGRSKKAWDLGFLRHLVAKFIELKGSFFSKDLEERWWNLVGFFLRPGYGSSLDEFRVKDLWKIFLQGSQKVLTLQQCICARRIAGGLKKGQQEQLAAKILPSLTKSQRGKNLPKQKGYVYTEELRLFANLELIDSRTKEKMADSLLQRISNGQALDVDYWALGRLAGRRLLYGSFVHLLALEKVSAYVEQLLTLKQEPRLFELLERLACKSGKRSFDLEEPLFKRVVQVIGKEPLLEDPCPEEQEKLFGESLPLGLSLMSGCS